MHLKLKVIVNFKPLVSIWQKKIDASNLQTFELFT